MAIMADQVLVQFIGDVRQLNTSLNKANKKLDQIKDSAMSAGKAINAAFTGVALAGLAIAVKGSVDLEKAMARVNTMAGLNKSQLESLKTEVLSLSSEYGKAATDIADSLFDITSAGYKGAEGMQVLNASLELSVAGFSDLKTTNEAVVRTLRAYGKSGSDAAKVIRILFSAMKVGIVDIPQLSSVFSRVAASAASIGVPLDEAAAAFARVTQVFRPAEAATMVDRWFSRLGSGSPKLKSVTEALTGPGGMVAAIEELRRISGGTREGLVNLGFAENDLKAGMLFLEEFSDTLAAVRSGGGELAKALKEAKGATAQKFAETIQVLKNELTKLGTEIIPALNVALKGFNKVGGGSILTWVAGTFAVRELFGALEGLIGSTKGAKWGLLASTEASWKFGAALKSLVAILASFEALLVTGVALSGVILGAALGDLIFGTTSFADALEKTRKSIVDFIVKTDHLTKSNKELEQSIRDVVKAQKGFNNEDVIGSNISVQEAKLKKLTSQLKNFTKLVKDRTTFRNRTTTTLIPGFGGAPIKNMTLNELKHIRAIRKRIVAQKESIRLLKEMVTLISRGEEFSKALGVAAFEILAKNLKKDNEGLATFDLLFKDVVNLMPKLDAEAFDLSKKFDDLLNKLLDFREGLLGTKSPLLQQALTDVNKLINLTKKQKKFALDALKASRVKLPGAIDDGPTGGVAAMDISTQAGVSAFLAARRAREDADNKKVGEKNLDANEKTEKNTRAIERELKNIKTGKITIEKVSM